MKKFNVLSHLRAIGSSIVLTGAGLASAEGLPLDESLVEAAPDWRQRMQAKGYQFEIGYLNQTAYLAHGGYTGRRSTQMIDQFHFKFTADLQKIAGIDDGAIEALAVNRNHDNNLTYRDLYDPQAPFVNSTQESHGRGSIWRLGLLSYRQSFLDRHLKIRAGLINKIWDFDDATPCDFQTLQLCGGKSGGSGIWYNWNVAQWGVSMQYRLAPQWTIKTAVYDQNPKRQDRNQAFSLWTSGTQGAIVPLELDYRPVFANGTLPGIYQFGLTTSNARSRDLYLASNDSPQALYPDLDAKTYRRQQYAYWNFTQQVTRRGAAADHGMHLFFTGGIGDRSAIVKQSYSTGIRYPGVFPQRSADVLGVGISYVRINKDYVNNDRLINRLNAGQAGFSPLLMRDAAEVVGEIYYRVQATPAIAIQPGLQYWRHPAGVGQASDAYVLGLKMTANF
jgi:porin